jgi:hypothetical protein
MRPFVVTAKDYKRKCWGGASGRLLRRHIIFAQTAMRRTAACLPRRFREAADQRSARRVRLLPRLDVSPTRGAKGGADSETFDDVYRKYNELQLLQGFDLRVAAESAILYNTGAQLPLGRGKRLPDPSDIQDMSSGDVHSPRSRIMRA